MKTVALGRKKIGPGQPCYLIAEIGGNFRTLAQAKRLIDLAARAGVDAVKFQTFRAATLTTRKAMFEMENTGRTSQYEHFLKYELAEDLHRAIFAYTRKKGLYPFSTPSHPTDVAMLEKVGCPAYKIGSDDAVNLPLIRAAARTGKPLLISTGMCTLAEVKRAVKAAKDAGNGKLVIFHCTTNYPTHLPSVNLLAMKTMMEALDVPVGYSDHTLGIDVCYAAAVMGARTLEFHFTHDKKADGPDHMLSKDFAETAALARKVRELPVLLGDGVKKPAETELTSLRNNRKSLVVTRPVLKGERFTARNLEPKRPGTGVACEHYDRVLGKKARRDLPADEPLQWRDIR